MNFSFSFGCTNYFFFEHLNTRSCKIIVSLLGTISIWSHQHFDHFVTTTHPSHHVITKLVIPYHLPTCHQLSSLGKQKKKEETNKECAVALVFFWRKQKRKNGLSKERSCCFFQAKGKRFFSFRAAQKKDKQTKLYCLKQFIVWHQKNDKSSPPTYLSSWSSGNEHFQTTHPPNHDDVILKWYLMKTTNFLAKKLKKPNFYEKFD